MFLSKIRTALVRISAQVAYKQIFKINLSIQFWYDFIDWFLKGDWYPTISVQSLELQKYSKG